MIWVIDGVMGLGWLFVLLWLVYFLVVYFGFDLVT